MSRHVEEELFDYLVGALDATDAASIAAHLRECATCAGTYRSGRDTFAVVGLSLASVAPPPSLRARIVGSLAGRFAGRVEQLATFFDLTAEAAGELLDSLDSTAAWEDGPMPGLRILTLPAGPRRAGAYTGLARMAPGFHFPAHRHIGREEMLVLAGGFRQHDGHRVETGEVLHRPAGSAHDFVVFDDEECIAAVVQYGGVEFGVLPD